MRISRPQPRIMSLAPNATSILVELRARKNLVAVSRWCADVSDVRGLPQLGDCWALDTGTKISVVGARAVGPTTARHAEEGDAAAISRLAPDYIIGSVPFRAEVVEKILGQSATFIALNPRSLNDIFRDIDFLGRLVNRNRAAAALTRRMQRTFAGIRRRVRRQRLRSRVYCEAWPNPRISSPPWVGELVEIAGGRVAVPSGQRVSDADVARAMPDVIVLAWTATGDRAKAESALNNGMWQDVPAVRNGRVMVIRDEWLNTPGPPLMNGAEALFQALHDNGK